MAKRKEVKIEPSTFRVMVEKYPYKQITVDFTTKEDALQYAHDLTEANTSWYGVYELNPRRDYLISVERNRLRPFDDKVTTPPKENEQSKPKRRSPHRVKQK